MTVSTRRAPFTARGSFSSRLAMKTCRRTGTVYNVYFSGHRIDCTLYSIPTTGRRTCMRRCSKFRKTYNTIPSGKTRKSFVVKSRRTFSMIFRAGIFIIRKKKNGSRARRTTIGALCTVVGRAPRSSRFARTTRDRRWRSRDKLAFKKVESVILRTRPVAQARNIALERRTLPPGVGIDECVCVCASGG